MKRMLLLWAWLFFCEVPAFPAEPVGQNQFVDAPSDFVVQHYGYKRRYSDYRASGVYVFYKIEFTNRDRVEHIINYDCFCLVDDEGYEYEVNTQASIEWAARWDDAHIRERDMSFNNKTLKPNLLTRGRLIFEVPKKGDNYYIKFRGYIK